MSGLQVIDQFVGDSSATVGLKGAVTGNDCCSSAIAANSETIANGTFVTLKNLFHDQNYVISA
jgi:hypothetical protein